MGFIKLMLVDGHVEEEWEQTTSSWIPIYGDFTNRGNWRQVALLDITFNFPLMVQKRVKPILEGQQSNDQIGFRSPVAVGDVFAVFKNVRVFKIYSLVGPDVVCKFGFAKTYDRTEYNALFDFFWQRVPPDLLVDLRGNVAVHQNVGMICGQSLLQSSSTMTSGGRLHAKLPRGSPLRNFMYSSAEPTL